MTDIAIERAEPRDSAGNGGVNAASADAMSGAGRDGNARDAGARDRAARAAAAAADEHRRAAGIDPLFGVRTADIEPYTGLRYLSKLFRMIAVVLVVLLVAEVATGIVRDGLDALTTLLAEVSRLIVLAGLLWGAGDLAILLIDVGHDVRAARILIARQTSHMMPNGPAFNAPHSAAHSAPIAAAQAPSTAAGGDADRPVGRLDESLGGVDRAGAGRG